MFADHDRTQRRRRVPRRISRGAALIAVALGMSLVSADPVAHASESVRHEPAAASANGSVEGATAPSKFVPVAPCRLVDTRDGDLGGRLPMRSTRTVSVENCVPTDATAVALTLTVVAPSGRGHATAYPGGRRPDSSSLNFVAGRTQANSAVTKLAGGGFDLWMSASGDVLIDVSGYFVPVPGAETSDGRFVPLTPVRALDSRTTFGRTTPGQTVVVDLPGTPPGAVAAAITVTTTATRGAGYFTVWGGGARPTASILNHQRGQTRAATVFAPVDANGDVRVFTRSGEFLIVDVLGYFTGPASPVSTEGLFVPVDPDRRYDSRPDEIVYGGLPVEVGTATYAAMVGNLTVVDAPSRTWLAVRAAGVPNERPDAASVSSINYDGSLPAVANQVVSRLSSRGLQVYSPEATDAVVDVTGYFTGAPLAPVDAVPERRPHDALRTVTIISDSAFAGVRWNGAYSALVGADYRPLLESCRRLVHPSCRGREGYRPATAVEEINRLPAARSRDVLVVSVGYNDWDSRFSADFDAVIAAARAKGFRSIAWMNYRVDNTYRLPATSMVDFANYARMNQIIEEKLASGAFTDVYLWDRDAFTRDAPDSWFTADGVHQRTAGSLAMAAWVSRQVAALG